MSAEFCHVIGVIMIAECCYMIGKCYHMTPGVVT